MAISFVKAVSIPATDTLSSKSTFDKGFTDGCSRAFSDLVLASGKEVDVDKMNQYCQDLLKEGGS
jgi:hypothetical protein